MTEAEKGFGIGEVAEQTGVGENTLRMWESRHGFPRPKRLPNGRRTYSRADVEQISTVLRIRSEGLSLPAAIERTRQIDEQPRLSVFRTLRERFPHLHARTMNKQALLWVTRAVEDECSARAVHPLLLGCFQEERFYRQSEHRWSNLARGARRAIAMADFPRLRVPRNGPVEVPLVATDALLGEWLVICHDEDISVCVVGRERPEDQPSRGFETIWTVEIPVVQEAARICLKLIARTAPALSEELLPLVSGPARPVDPADLQIPVDLASRVTGYATGNPDV